MNSDRTTRVQPIRSQKVAELVADRLRARILSGELSDGDRLPKEDDLRLEFPVGKPSLREALRILETEGLISVLRGKRGGAMVHAPKAPNAAYTLGLVLGTQHVLLADVARALRELEPLCVALCAERPDRHEKVLPILRTLHEQTIAALDDSLVFTHRARTLHEEMVAQCNNRTLILLVGALEMLWSSHVRVEVVDEMRRGFNRGNASRAETVEEHRRILDLMDAGDADGVRAVARAHLERVNPRRLTDAGQRVSLEASQLARNLVVAKSAPSDHQTG